MRYPGGKNADGTWQRIISQIPPHQDYCEPFLGSGAVMRRKRPALVSTGIDRDPGALAGFRECARADLQGVDFAHIDLGGLGKFYSGNGPDLQGIYRNYSRPTLVLVLADALDWLAECVWSDNQVIYADPPYLPETRTKKRLYEHELTPEQHEHLLEILVGVPCRVLLSGYPSKMYAERLADWRCIEYDAMTRGGVTRRECLWCNFPEPDQLHDYRQLGADYRQRERIRRQQRNWARRLARLPTLERRAMLAVLTEAAP